MNDDTNALDVVPMAMKFVGLYFDIIEISHECLFRQVWKFISSQKRFLMRNIGTSHITYCT